MFCFWGALASILNETQRDLPLGIFTNTLLGNLPLSDFC